MRKGAIEAKSLTNGAGCSAAAPTLESLPQFHYALSRELSVISLARSPYQVSKKFQQYSRWLCKTSSAPYSLSLHSALGNKFRVQGRAVRSFATAGSRCKVWGRPQLICGLLSSLSSNLSNLPQQHYLLQVALNPLCQFSGIYRKHQFTDP